MRQSLGNADEGSNKTSNVLYECQLHGLEFTTKTSYSPLLTNIYGVRQIAHAVPPFAKSLGDGV